MRTKQSILGLVHPRGEIRRPPLVGMQFLHERTVGSTDLVARVIAEKMSEPSFM